MGYKWSAGRKQLDTTGRQPLTFDLRGAPDGLLKKFDVCFKGTLRILDDGEGAPIVPTIWPATMANLIQHIQFSWLNGAINFSLTGLNDFAMLVANRHKYPLYTSDTSLWTPDDVETPAYWEEDVYISLPVHYKPQFKGRDDWNRRVSTRMLAADVVSVDFGVQNMIDAQGDLWMTRMNGDVWIDLEIDEYPPNWEPHPTVCETKEEGILSLDKLSVPSSPALVVFRPTPSEGYLTAFSTATLKGGYQNLDAVQIDLLGEEHDNEGKFNEMLITGGGANFRTYKSLPYPVQYTSHIPNPGIVNNMLNIIPLYHMNQMKVLRSDANFSFQDFNTVNEGYFYQRYMG